MVDQPDFIKPSRCELQQLVMEAVAVMIQPQVLHRVLWQLDCTTHDGACLTVGLPRTITVRCRDAFHGRLVWWPDGITFRRRVTILSSRIGARHDRYRWWFDLLRTAVLRVDADEECVVAVEGTAPHAPAIRAAEIFGIPHLNVTVQDGEVDAGRLVDWLATRIGETYSGRPDAGPLTWRAVVSPRLRPAAVEPVTGPIPPAPVADQCAVASGERSLVVACRSGGHIHSLLSDRLETPVDGASICCVASGPGVSGKVFDDLVGLGAVPWLVAGIHTASERTGSPSSDALSEPVLHDGPLVRPQDWFCHWTRPCTGPWPGQSTSDYLDELLLGCETSDRSALATLLRIIAHRTVLASVIRGRHRAVSFTAVPLSKFRQRRVYRRHRRRYDFEPWGIAVRRDALADLGIQPVRYGSRDDSQSEPESGLFQPATDRAGVMNWCQEQEWRLMRDLRLDEITGSAICLFVNSSVEAERVRDQCVWPVVVVPH